MKRFFLWAVCILTSWNLWANDKAWVQKNYRKTEVMIPMRDGTKLYTAIYAPLKSSSKSPFLMRRTPYGCAYGDSWEGSLWSNWHKYAEEGYIFVFQDVRGKGKSEGDYVDIRPVLPQKHDKKAFDETTDTYDTSDWLLRNVANNNGCIGLTGNSYCGFYAIQGALCGHKAIKVAVPQAPVFNWFMGDDFHHNGAFMVRDAFGFMNRHCRVRPAVGEEAKAPDLYYTDDYSYFQDKCINDLSKVFKGEVPFWTDMCNHPDEDSWWQERDYVKALPRVKAAVMVVGGLWDAEDYYGACQLYQNLLKAKPEGDIRLTLGPWSHGGWNGSKNNLGNYSFGEENLCRQYQDEIELNFVQHYLKDASIPLPSEEKARIFFTGENRWHTFAQWPQADQKSFTFYLHQGGVLSAEAPAESASSTSYVSDPDHPVPFMEGTLYHRPADYMTADQRFAERRSDVIAFKTAPLTEDITLAGDVNMDLKVAISTSDADFVVKLLDVYPDNYNRLNPGTNELWNGYELPVRMDIMRGRYRDGFSKGEAFTPGQMTTVPVHMQGIAHTFRKGHRIAVQIQSSWFPLADMNPQQFVNIYKCERKDFVKSQITVYHQQSAPSRIVIGK